MLPTVSSFSSTALYKLVYTESYQWNDDLPLPFSKVIWNRYGSPIKKTAFTDNSYYESPPVYIATKDPA